MRRDKKPSTLSSSTLERRRSRRVHIATPVPFSDEADPPLNEETTTTQTRRDLQQNIQRTRELFNNSRDGRFPPGSDPVFRRHYNATMQSDTHNGIMDGLGEGGSSPGSSEYSLADFPTTRGQIGRQYCGPTQSRTIMPTYQSNEPRPLFQSNDTTLEPSDRSVQSPAKRRFSPPSNESPISYGTILPTIQAHAPRSLFASDGSELNSSDASRPATTEYSSASKPIATYGSTRTVRSVALSVELSTSEAEEEIGSDETHEEDLAEENGHPEPDHSDYEHAIQRQHGSPCIFLMTAHCGQSSYAVFDPFMSVKCEPGKLPEATTFSAHLQLDVHGRWCIMAVTTGEKEQGAAWVNTDGDSILRQMLVSSHSVFLRIKWHASQAIRGRGTLYQGVCDWSAYCHGSSPQSQSQAIRSGVARQVSFDHVEDLDSDLSNNDEPLRRSLNMRTDLPKESSIGPTSSVMDEVFRQLSAEKDRETKRRNRFPSEPRYGTRSSPEL